MRRWAVFLTILSGGCSLVTSLSGFSGGPDQAGADGGDASASVDASDGSVSALTDPNVVSNATFDTSCSGWKGYHSNVDVTTIEPRTGAGACRVCVTSTNDGAGIEVPASVVRPELGERFHAEGWMRASRSSDSPSVLLALRSQAGREQLEWGEKPPRTASTEWQKVDADLTISKSADSLLVYFFVSAPKLGECFDVDDVVVTRSP